MIVSVPSVFSLTQRKQDFSSLLKSLSQIFMLSSDDRVLRNTAVSLTHFLEGDHSRLDDVRAELKSIAENLMNKILNHILEHGVSPTKSSEGSMPEDSLEVNSESSVVGGTEEKKENDVQFSLSVAVKKLSILSKRCNISTFLGDEKNDELVSAISDGIKQKLELSREMTSNDVGGKPHMITQKFPLSCIL